LLIKPSLEVYVKNFLEVFKIEVEKRAVDMGIIVVPNIVKEN
jgi:hypothetical protein